MISVLLPSHNEPHAKEIMQEIEDLILNRHSRSIVNLPRQISISKQKGKIVLTSRNA